MTSIYERLQALQINLPEVPPPVVDGYVPSFVPFVRTGNLIYLSGRLAKKDGKPFSGKVGQEITTAEGRQAARDVAIELLATLHGALHDLNRVKRIVRLLVLVNSAPGFTEPHEVANGASELFLEVFGERGAHARSTFGAAQIPFGSCVEIEIIVEVSDSDSECQLSRAHRSDFVHRRMIENNVNDAAASDYCTFPLFAFMEPVGLNDPTPRSRSERKMAYE